MNRLFCSGLFALGLLFVPNVVDAKLNVVAEINFIEGGDGGVVRAAGNAKVAVSILVDWELADANDDIKIITVALSRLSIKKFYHLHTDGLIVRTRNTLLAESFLRLTLFEPILGVGKTKYDFVLGVKTPRRPMVYNTGIYISNSQKIKIAKAVSGQADGIENNDSLKFEVIRDVVAPPPVKGFTVRNSNDGLGHVLISWQESENIDVDGYFVFRNVSPKLGSFPTFISVRRSWIAWRDTEVQRGLNTYIIVSFKDVGFGIPFSLRSTPVSKTLFVEPTRVEKHISLSWGFVKTRKWGEVLYAN